VQDAIGGGGDGVLRNPNAGLLALAVLLVVYAALAVAYRKTVPLFEAPDEPSHLHYAAFVKLEHRLPRFEQTPEVPGEGMQPPLAYVLAAPFLRMPAGELAALLPELTGVSLSVYGLDTSAILDTRVRAAAKPREGRFFLPLDPALLPLANARWPSLLFGLLTVTFTFLAVLRAGGDSGMALLAAGLIALSPQFLFLSGYFSNDPAATAIGAAAFWLVAAAFDERSAGPRRVHYLGAGLLVSLGILTKNSTLPGLGVAALAIFFVDGRPIARRAMDAALAATLLALLAGPYMVWNTAYRGDPLGGDALWLSASGLPRPDRLGGAWAYLTSIYWDWTFESYWARFGWMTVRVPKAVYLAFFALAWTGLLGFVLADLPRCARRLRGYVFGAVLATLTAHVWLNLHTVQPQGRHLFAVAPEIAFTLAVGISSLGDGRAQHARLRTVLCVLVPLCGLALYCLFGVIGPAYR
jgi:hypothetical protein